jgi:hypothetical protein
MLCGAAGSSASHAAAATLPRSTAALFRAGSFGFDRSAVKLCPGIVCSSSVTNQLYTLRAETRTVIIPIKNVIKRADCEISIIYEDEYSRLAILESENN